MSKLHDTAYITKLVEVLSEGLNKTSSDVVRVVMDTRPEPSQLLINYKDGSFISILINRSCDFAQSEPSKTGVH